MSSSSSCFLFLSVSSFLLMPPSSYVLLSSPLLFSSPLTSVSLSLRLQRTKRGDKLPAALSSTLEGTCSKRLKKRTHPLWSKDEDERLTSVVNSLREKGVRKEAIFVEAEARMMGRDAKQCELRWNSVLRPDRVRGAWSEHEDEHVGREEEEQGKKGKTNK
jgi:hypothetical protein